MSWRLSKAYVGGDSPVSLAWQGRLPPRLAAIADRIPKGLPMADIGSDHARLPEALLLAAHVPRAIAVDRAKIPLERAKRRLPHEPRLAFYQGDGLLPLRPGEVHAAVFAGLGGRAIQRMLSEGAARALGVQRLILQPETEDLQLRLGLPALGYRITEEALVADHGRVFLVITAEASERPLLPPPLLEAWLGPHLGSTPLSREWLQIRKRWLRRQTTQGPEAEERELVLEAIAARLGDLP